MRATIPVLLLAFGLSAPPSDVYTLPDPNLEIPINIKEDRRAEIRELVLYLSDNQGRTWKEVAKGKPEDTAFKYNVRSDGLYYFAVVAIDKFGVPEMEASKAKHLKIQVESRKPATPGDPPPPSMPDATPPPPAFVPTNPVTPPAAPAPAPAPAAGVTQTNSLTVPGPIAPIAPVAPPPAIQPPAEQPPAVPPPQPPIAPPPPPSNDGPGSLAPLAPMKPGIDPAPRPAAPAQPAGETPPPRTPLVQHVRDLQVALDFEVERKGPSGVKKIETWITQDDGNTWQKWAETLETVSPLQLRLPEAEGVFGFRMVLYSGVMQTVGAPRRGDEPDVKLQIDRTPPVVAYYTPVPDATHPNAITLRYSVSDANLDPASILLQWSRQPNAGWQTIQPTNVRPMPSSGVAGMREGSWQLPPDLPDSVYLRLVARDMAGNVGEFITREPQTVDLYKPTARIKAVLPAGGRR